ncbi:arylsulfatase [Lentisphaera profundi]|uniref:Arylsulfatase n=1 Tax=Lentisphaera profundi TaxID=1658616 RepID=A0ABY7W2K1_9BACT|nr:arylsulfatase [Lentisphaera profundi]WDE99342.1 arylsulfatase [Lentisphaera profundi]
MNKYLIIAMATMVAAAIVHATDTKRPNIVFIFADDMGYGDVQCLNPKRGKIPTPHLDKLASEGMIFTDAHTSSSVCTPSRYGLLTGRYNWRTHLQKGVIFGFSPALIDAKRLTVASLLKQQGYTTACIGKWHLGMTLPTTNGVLPKTRVPKKLNVVWDGRITDGPTAVGFDYFWGISASLDMAPCLYIENDHFIGDLPPQDGKSSTTKSFKIDQVLPHIGKQSAAYIKASKPDTPFFLYASLTSPHTPIRPTAEWIGKSGISKYADFQMQTDHVIGVIIDAIDSAGLRDNTLVIVSSDNGCSKAAKIPEMEAKGHFPSAQFRGSKSDLWEGGHRMPFIVRWPKVVEAGSQSDQTVCLTDFMATCAEIVEAQLPSNAAEDSVSFLPALKDKPIVSTRKGVIHHSISGHFSYRMGKWKLLLAKGSGGWTAPKEKDVGADSPKAQLYDLEADPGETNNLYKSKPEVVEQLLEQLTADIERGRSTDGPKASNDVSKVVLWKR